MYRNLPRALSVALAVTLFAPGAVSAQDEASITGSVTDATGLILPGVTVEAEDSAGTTEVTFTDGTGQFSFSGLAPGTYEVTFTLPGFSAPGETVQVSDGATATVDVEMEVGLEERVVVVGTRAQPRSVTASPVPVDVIRSDDFASQGATDLATQLRAIVPSFNINIQPISDAATIVRPANLRNLAPDHTLVLVNGKRRHRAAVITWLGNGIADGSQGPDISVIPSIAIRQAEVLRDGAAAQYGSDAIAGVMNFQLKDARQGGSLEFRTGAYRDANPGDTSTCGAGIIGDIQHSCNGIGGKGQAYTVAANAGVPLGRNGFLNVSLEYGNANPTNRSVQRDGANSIIQAGNDNLRNPAQVWGSPVIEDDLKLFGNFGSLFDNGLQFYGHTNYASRKVTGGFYFRNPHTRGGVFRGDKLDDGTPTLRVGDRVWADTGVAGAGNCSTIPIIGNVPDAGALAAVEADPNCFTLYSRFPGGFTPQFGGTMIDYSLVSGLRGFTSTGLNWDASVNIGHTEVDQFIFDTVNASLGYDTPTSFHPGIYGQEDINLNFDVSIPVTNIVNFAAGTEWRNEEFTIGAGGQPSWEIGPYAAQGFSSGSNGFNGYRADTTAGQWSRSNVAVYGDLEFNDPGGRWTFGSAVRLEDFSDFGTTTNGKISARLGLTDAFSLRGGISTGFRAPTPGQQNAFNVTTAFIGGELTNNGVVPSTSAVAVARGGGQLQPEKSRNYSAGAVFEQGPFTFTTDFFRIDIADRVSLSQEISLSENEIVTLLAEGIPEARNFPVFRFFLNDFSTTTQGLDMISTLALGSTSISGIFNYTDTEIKDLQSSVIDDFRIATLENGLPNTRWTLNLSHAADRWRMLARVSYFGSYWDSEDGRNSTEVAASGILLATLYPPYSGKALVDVELGIPFGDGVELAIGAENLLNQYPDINQWGAQTVGNNYGQFSPFGFNGAYYYTRVSYGWGG